MHNTHTSMPLLLWPKQFPKLRQIPDAASTSVVAGRGGNKKTQKRKKKTTSNLFPPTVYLKSFEERNGSNNNTRAKKESKVPEGTAADNDGMKEQEEEEAEAGDKAPAGARTGSGMQRSAPDVAAAIANLCRKKESEAKQCDTRRGCGLLRA